MAKKKESCEAKSQSGDRKETSRPATQWQQTYQAMDVEQEAPVCEVDMKNRKWYREIPRKILYIHKAFGVLVCRLAMEEGQFHNFRDKIETYESEKQEQNPKDVGQLQRKPHVASLDPSWSQEEGGHIRQPCLETTSECHM